MEIDMNAYDPVLEEIYAIRRKISERYGHNVYRLAEAVAERQRIAEAKGRKYVRLPVARDGACDGITSISNHGN